MTFRYAELESAITDSVRRMCEGKRVAVAFSGGLDSGLVAAIAREHAESVRLYTCGTSDSYDVRMARDLSERLDLPWVHAEISLDTMEARIREMIAATGTSDPFTISYEMPLFRVCQEADEDVILSGQGADEYFMGCAKFVGKDDEEYRTLRDAGVERLLGVSVPCEISIASHFGMDIRYPYLDPSVTSLVEAMDPEELRPDDMDSRKAVLKAIAIHLGHMVLADRKKKSSQYGSRTTDLIRSLARAQGLQFNEYVESLYADVFPARTVAERCAVIHARVNRVLKEEAELVLYKSGISPSEAIDRFYRKVIEEGGLDFLGK